MKTENNRKIVLITGVSKGIGKSLTKKMLADNYFVIGTSRDGNLKEFEGENFYPVALDLTNLESIETAQKTILEKFPQMDILINNAGVGPDLGSQEPDRKSFTQTFEVNVSGTVFFTEPIINSFLKMEKLSISPQEWVRWMSAKLLTRLRIECRKVR